MLRPFLLSVLPFANGLNGFLGALSSFNTAYAIVRKNEGGYVNDPADKGGMTYMGIARNIHPTWYGWKIIDEFHDNSGIEMDRGAFLPMREQNMIEPYVIQFYQQMWNQSRAGEIQSQSVANLYFDFYIHSRGAVGEVQKVLNSMGASLKVDNLIGPKTLAAINSMPPEELHDAIKQGRLRYIEGLVSSGNLASKYLEPIENRIAAFPDLFNLTSDKGTNKILWVTGILCAMGIVWSIRENADQKLKHKDYEN